MQPNSSSKASQHDEIDFIEIWNATIKHWKLISAITVAFVTLAVIYLALTPKVYKSTAVLTSANPSELNKLNNGLELVDLSEKKAFKELYRVTTQSDLQRAFFKAHIYDAATQTTDISLAFDQFKRALEISDVSKKNAFQSLQISHQSIDPDFSAQVLAEYIKQVNLKLNYIYINNYQAKLISLKRKTERLIEQLTNTADQETAAEIYRLREAIDVAKALNIETPASNTFNSNLVLDGSLSSQSIPLYSLGYKALELKVKSLENREDNALFTKGYSALVAKLKALNSIQLPEQALTLYSYEQTPTSHPIAIKPKSTLILALSVLLGLMIGMLAAIIKYYHTTKVEKSTEH